MDVGAWELITSWTLAVVAFGLMGIVAAQWAQWRTLHRIGEKVDMLTRPPDAILLLCHACQSGIVVTEVDKAGPTMAHHQEFECPARGG